MATHQTAPMLIVISAPSGAGKTTLCKRLLEDFRGLRLSISTTTRPLRGQEQHGRDYFFVDRPAFENEIQAGTFAEWALVHGNYYGTSRRTLESFFAAGLSVLLDIDVQGAASLKRAYGDRCATIFVAPPSLEVLEARLRSRGTDPEESIQRRMRNSRNEMARAGEFDHQIVNDDLDGTYARLKGLIGALLEGGA